MRRTALLMFLLFFLYFDCLPQTNCSVLSKCFASGESIHYQVYYNIGFIWINAGNIDFRAKSTDWNGKHVYRLTAFGKTNNSFESFFPVRDSLISYVDSSAITPYRALKRTHEGKWHGADDFTFRKNESGWRITTRLKRKGKWKEPVEAISTECGFDILTSIYRLRSMSDSELHVIGKCFTIPLRLDDGEYKVYMTYLGRENVKLHGVGTYPAITFQLTLVEGSVFGRGEVLKLWISDDRNKIPLLVESPIKMGKVKAVFKSAEKTLFPLGKPLTE